MSLLTQVDLLTLLIYGEVARQLLFRVRVNLTLLLDQLRNNGIYGTITIGTILCWSRDDQWGTRLIDKDRVDLIHYRKIEFTLYPFCCRERHVVAQVVKSKLVIGSIDDVTGIGLLTQHRLHAREDGTGGQTQETIELGHPLRITPSQIVVNRDDMDPITTQGIQIGGQSGH